MKKTLLLSVLLLFLLSLTAHATDFGFTAFYPIPSGNYQKIRLFPQGALTPNNCPPGTMYANSDNNDLPYFCLLNGFGLPEFTLLSGPWTLNGDDLFLTDPATPATKKVAIGTATPIFKLTLVNDGGILADGLASASSALASSGAETKLIWYPLKGAFRAGYVPANQWDNINIGTNSMAMGYGNTAASQGTSIWGGQNNSASGGASPWAAVIAGGLNNTTTSELAQILGGRDNRAGIGAHVSGFNNIGNGSYSTIGGGNANNAAGSYSTISGGWLNTTASSVSATISGGRQNSASGDYNTISGGISNQLNAGSSYSTISGGYNNISNAAYTVISGGREQRMINSTYAVILGGVLNTTNGLYATISGGNSNTSGPLASVTGSGGQSTGNATSILAAGAGNSASADHCVIIGGRDNTASGSYSLTAGKSMNNSGNHSFVWGYSTSATNITSANSLVIFSGNMGIRDISPNALLEINANGSSEDYLNLTSSSIALPGNILKIDAQGRIGVNKTNPSNLLEFENGAYVSNTGNFINGSSQSYKENIADLNISDALSAFSKLKPVGYNYKNEPSHRYLGFIAQDVPDIVSDKNRQGLSPMDIAAVLTKVIKHQQNILEEQKITRERLREEIIKLKTKN